MLQALSNLLLKEHIIDLNLENIFDNVPHNLVIEKLPSFFNNMSKNKQQRLIKEGKSYSRLEVTSIVFRIKPEELYILSCGKGLGRRPRPFPQLRM